MPIDEIITAERDNAEFSKLNNHEGSADYHNKISELLEELKAYRENSNGYNKEDIELNRNAMYNKAIDDFVKAIVDRGLSSNDDKYCITRYDNYLKVIKEIAEQLKEGGKNEKERNAFDNAKQIVQEVAEEFATDTNVGTNGWIPCSGCKDCKNKECEHYGKV